MVNFTINGADAPTTSIVNFKTEINIDGDLVVKANGVRLFYIDKSDGKLHRFYATNVQGLMFDSGGRIIVTP